MNSLCPLRERAGDYVWKNKSFHSIPISKAPNRLKRSGLVPGYFWAASGRR